MLQQLLADVSTSIRISVCWFKLHMYWWSSSNVIADVVSCFPWWLHVESECRGLSSDLSYTYTSQSHLNHRRHHYKASIMLHTSLVRWVGEKPSATTAEISASKRWVWHVTQNTTDILLLSIVTLLRVVRMSWSFFWPIVYLLISFEPPTLTLQGIDHAPHIVGSVRNQAQQLLRWLYSRNECGTKHYRHSLAFPRDSECRGLSSDYIYLLVSFEPPTSTLQGMLHKSRSPRSRMEGLRPWKEMLSIAWFAQHK